MVGAVTVKFNKPLTVTLFDELPPLPEHDNVKILSPFFLIFIASEPDNDLDPAQSPLAVQDEEFVDVHVSVISWLTSDEELDVDSVTTGAGTGAGSGYLLGLKLAGDWLK